MAKASQYSRSRKRSRSLTSITAWRRFATHRLIYVGIAALFALGMVVYFGGTPSGGRDEGSTSAGSAIVTVNGEPVTHAQFESMWEAQQRQMPGAGQNAAQDASMQGMLLTRMVDDALLRSIARDKGVKVPDSEVDKQIQQLREQIGSKKSPASDEDLLQTTGAPSMDDLRTSIRNGLVRQEFAKSLAASQPTTEDDLQKTYEQAKLRHILIATTDSKRPAPGALTDAQAKKRADMIMAELKGGADFAELADKYSMDPGNKRPTYDAKTKRSTTKPQGGELGWAPLSKYVPEFADAARKLKPGELAGPVRTPFGYHMIKMEEFKRELPADYAKRKGDLLKEYKEQKAQEAIQKMVDDARKSAKIVWNDPSYKWRYDMMASMYSPDANMDPQKAQQKLVAELRAYLKKNPDDSAAALTLGQMLYSTEYMSFPQPGKPAQTAEARAKVRAEIIQDYKTALARTEDRGVRFTLAELYEEAGQKDKALEQYKRIKSLLSYDTSPDSKMAHMRLLAAFHKLGETQLETEEQAKVAQITADEKKRADEEKAEKARLAAQKKIDDEKIAKLRREKGASATTPTGNAPTSGGTAVAPGGSVTVQPGGSLTVTPSSGSTDTNKPSSNKPR